MLTSAANLSEVHFPKKTMAAAGQPSDWLFLQFPVFREELQGGVLGGFPVELIGNS